jgi:hypothetical protein
MDFSSRLSQDPHKRTAARGAFESGVPHMIVRRGRKTHVFPLDMWDVLEDDQLMWAEFPQRLRRQHE